MVCNQGRAGQIDNSAKYDNSAGIVIAGMPGELYFPGMSTAKNKIEIAGATRRFTPDELRAKAAESRQFWNSPQGKQRKAALDAEQRTKKPSGPARFPQVAGTKPILSISSKIAIASAKSRR